MGLSAFAAAMAAMSYPEWFLTIWLTEAVVALAIGLIAMAAKAHGFRVLVSPVRHGNLRLSFAPPLLVGGVLTPLLLRADVAEPAAGCMALHVWSRQSSPAELSPFVWCR